MSTKNVNIKTAVVRELALFLVLLFVGLVILPLCVYVVGRSLFGEYAGTGFSDFYGVLHSKFRSGEPVVWFLMLSPYLIWQMLRMTISAFRRVGKSHL